MSNDKNRSRRRFIQEAGIAGAGLVLAGPLQTSGQTNNVATMSININSRSYAGKDVVGTYGTPEASSPTGITQGGYANNFVVMEHFAIKIPKHIDLKYAAPLLCAGITTSSLKLRK